MDFANLSFEARAKLRAKMTKTTISLTNPLLLKIALSFKIAKIKKAIGKKSEIKICKFTTGMLNSTI